MGYQGNGDLNRIQRHEFYNPHELNWNLSVSSGAGHSEFRRDRDDRIQQKREMYSVPMPSIFNFHLKMDENQQHQFQLQQVPIPSNGMLLKKEIVINSQGQLVPAHSSQGITIVTPGAAHPPAPSAPSRQEENFVLEHHMKVNKSNPKPYQCNYCNKAYKQLMGIKNHIKTHMQTNKGIHHCTLCGKTSEYQSTAPTPFVCNSCREAKHQIQQQQQQQQQQIHHHQQQHQPQQQHGHHSLVGVNYHQAKPNPGGEEEEESCPESEKQYSCQYCHKRFQHPSTLKMHLKKHTDDKPFVCSHCNKHFKRNSSLKIHERTHTGEKTHECSYCGKLFAYEVFLKVHLRKHTGEKPYHCQLCDKTFTQAGNLKSHVKRKHIGSEDILNILT